MLDLAHYWGLEIMRIMRDNLNEIAQMPHTEHATFDVVPMPTHEQRCTPILGNVTHVEERVRSHTAKTEKRNGVMLTTGIGGRFVVSPTRNYRRKNV